MPSAEAGILDAIYAHVNVGANSELHNKGDRLRAHDWQDKDLPRWRMDVAGLEVLNIVGGEYECAMELVFVAHGMGAGADNRVFDMKQQFQAAIADRAFLAANKITAARFINATPDLDEDGAAKLGTIRASFQISYLTNEAGEITT